MTLRRIEIKGLRGFEEKGIINLAIPNGDYGSGLTILVGPNNSGKSTIVEAFSALSSMFTPLPKKASFNEEMRNKKHDEISIKAIDNPIEGKPEGYFEIINTSSLKSETSYENHGFPYQQEGNIFVLPSRRTFDPYYHGIPSELSHREEYINQFELPLKRGSKLSTFFRRISKANKMKKEFNEVMSKILSPLPKWELDRNGSDLYYMKFIYDDISHASDGPISHASDGSGDGLLSIFFIVDALYDSNPNSIIVIDEPELSLHPSIQKKLSKLFAEYAKDQQIIIATHSPYFIDWDAIFNGASIIRVVKEGRKTCIYPKEKLDDTIIEKLKNQADDINNPHVLGLDAKEIFFLEDNIILTEGQEDVVHYNIILRELGKKLNGEFFGWGVGGADKMQFIAHLLHELGYKKVIGILDSDKKSVKDSLKKKFPDYSFLCIPAEDVRTKEPRERIPGKNGLLNTDHKLKEEYKECVKEIFDRIERIFDGSEDF